MNRTAHVPFAALLPPPSPPPLPLPAAVSSCFSTSSMSQVFTGLTSVGHAWEQGWEGEARSNAERERLGAHHVTAGRGVTVPA
jgi:hypothetical protein